MGKVLDGFPWWSQLSDIDPTTKRPDVYASTDCGEEVASIWIAGKTDIYTDAADLRRILPGHSATGITSAGDVQEMLLSHGIRAAVATVDAARLQPMIRGEIEVGDPVAVLGYWISPDILHWILGVGFGNDGLIAMEPWTGRMVVYRWSTVRALATGTIVLQDAIPTPAKG